MSANITNLLVHCNSGTAFIYERKNGKLPLPNQDVLNSVNSAQRALLNREQINELKNIPGNYEAYFTTSEGIVREFRIYRLYDKKWLYLVSITFDKKFKYKKEDKDNPINILLDGETLIYDYEPGILIPDTEDEAVMFTFAHNHFNSFEKAVDLLIERNWLPNGIKLAQRDIYTLECNPNKHAELLEEQLKAFEANKQRKDKDLDKDQKSNSSSSSSLTSSLSASSSIPSAVQDTFITIFEKCISKDPFNNCIIDLSGPEANKEYSHQVATDIFSRLLKNEDGHEHLLVRFSPTNTHLYTHLISSGFTIHNGRADSLLVKRCLGHQEADCAYPAFKTMSVGITVVIFNQSLSHFLAVQEKSGPYRGWKAPTGTVDYENEDELQAAAREIKEETNIDIEKEQLSLVAMAPTNSFRGRSPDRNFVFTCKHTGSSEIRAQEKEIRKVEWISVDEFLNKNDLVAHQFRPLILQEVVRIARENLLNNQGWKPANAFWGSGKATTLFSKI